MLATAWWWLPLLLLGRYSVPFLDYIENATITTVPTDLAHTLVGEADWVAYFAGIDYQAGQQLVTERFDFGVLASRLEDFYQQVVAGPPVAVVTP